MKVKNISGKIIGIGALTLLPDSTGIIPQDYEKNPVIEDYIKNNILSLLDNAKTKKTEFPNIDDEEKLAAENLKKAKLASLKTITDENLQILATELGINLADCKDTGDIKKKVAEALKKT